MGDELLTTRDAAELLGVSPSTVKRWAEQGLLPCEHTAGGHRRFRGGAVQDLLDASRRSASAPPLGGLALEDADGSGGSGGSWIARTLDLALTSDDLTLLVHALHDRHAALGAWWAVADDVGQVLAALGRAWASGALTVIDEHLASERLRRAVLSCADTFRPAPGAPRALLATAHGEDHDLGLVLAELALREAGWTVRWAGRRSPVGVLLDYLDRGGLDLVVLTASSYATDALSLADEAATITRAARHAQATVLLGGSGHWPSPPPPGAVRLHSFAALHRWLAERAAPPQGLAR